MCFLSCNRSHSPTFQRQINTISSFAGGEVNDVFKIIYNFLIKFPIPPPFPPATPPITVGQPPGTYLRTA